MLRALAVSVIVLEASAGAATAQSEKSPVESRTQFLATRAGTVELLVEPGVTQVWLDLRRPDSGAGYTLRTPAGTPFEPAERLAVAQDAPEGDLLGGVMDVSSFAPEPGTYRIESTGPLAGTAVFEGGAGLRFWRDPDGTLRPDETLTLWAELVDGHGRPIEGAAIEGRLERTADPAGRPGAAVVHTLAFAASREPGRHSVVVPGLGPSGVYTLSLSAETGWVRRHLVTSLGVRDRPQPGPSAPVTPVTELDGGANMGSVATESAPGTIVYGPTGGADMGRPVVVFVHGFHASTSTWIGSNGMYAAALDDGYRVAVVRLHPDRSFHVNGALLATLLPAISAHYDVRRMVVVAHSKGGVDTDAALLLHGGTDLVRTVLTLGTPHHGTPLADLADSTWFSWLADVFGFRNEAQRSMKPGQMALYRAEVAQHPRNTPQWLDFRSFGGWKYWNNDPYLPHPAYFFGGLYLKQHGGGSGNGGNDGVVNYRDSRRPVGLEIFGGQSDSRTGYNHRQLRYRNKYWRHVDAQLLTSDYDNSPTAPADVAASYREVTPALRGILVTWRDRSRHESGFLWERSVDGGPFVASPYPLPPNTEELFDLYTEPGRSYRYRLRAAIGTRWLSDYSNVASASHPAPLPAAPSHLAAAVQGPRHVRLTWRDNGPWETRFEVWRRAGGAGGFSLRGTTGPDVQTFHDTAVVPGASYEYRVRAGNASGVSAFTSSVTVTLPAELATPAGLSASYDAASDRIRLAWTDTSTGEDGFHVQFRYGGSDWADLYPATVGPNVTVYWTGPHPPPGGYDFRVRAFVGGAVSAWSHPASLWVPYAAAGTGEGDAGVSALGQTGSRTTRSVRPGGGPR